MPRSLHAVLTGMGFVSRNIALVRGPLTRAMFLETNPIPVKTACRLLGMAAGPLRLPLADMTESNEKTLRAELQRSGERP